MNVSRKRFLAKLLARVLAGAIGIALVMAAAHIFHWHRIESKSWPDAVACLLGVLIGTLVDAKVKRRQAESATRLDLSHR